MRIIVVVVCLSGFLLYQAENHKLPRPVVAAAAAQTSIKGSASDKRPDIPALIKQLKDTDPKNRIKAAAALGQLGPSAKEAVPALIEALKDKDRDVRRQCAEALCPIGRAAKAAIPALKEAIKDKDPGLRWRAANALWAADGKDLEKLVIVMQEAAKALDRHERDDALDARAWAGALETYLRFMEEPIPKRGSDLEDAFMQSLFNLLENRMNTNPAVTSSRLTREKHAQIQKGMPVARLTALLGTATSITINVKDGPGMHWEDKTEIAVTFKEGKVTKVEGQVSPTIVWPEVTLEKVLKLHPGMTEPEAIRILGAGSYEDKEKKDTGKRLVWYRSVHVSVWLRDNQVESSSYQSR